MADVTKWEGLTLAELLVVERVFCLHDKRKEAQSEHDVGFFPMKVCSWLLQQMLDHVKEMRKANPGLTKSLRDRGLADRPTQFHIAGFALGNCNRNQEISDFLNRNTRCFGKMAKARRNWQECRKMVECVLLGDARRDRQSADAQDKQREAVARRILDFFFEKTDLTKDEGPEPDYFVHKLLAEDAPGRRDEAAYLILDLAWQSAWYREPSSLYLVSGGSAFGQVQQSIASPGTYELTRLGLITLTAAIAGTSVYFILPALRSRTSAARESAGDYFTLANEYLMRGSVPEYLDSIAGWNDSGVMREEDEAAQALQTLKLNMRRAALARLWMVPVSPVGVQHGNREDTPELWAGQFFNPVFRYAYLEYPGGSERPAKFFISREQNALPFAFSTTQREREAFLEWRKAFAQTRQRGATTAWKYVQNR